MPAGLYVISNVENVLQSKHYFTHYKFCLKSVHCYSNMLLEWKTKRGSEPLKELENNEYVQCVLMVPASANESFRNQRGRRAKSAENT